ncbi:MAG: two component LuxR family transcriptional regulator [Ferruginibacter sp.]|uniref:response regulator n=1 Tax=Ferruginibacter sp. TaxID=1940288 RepID=UPI00265AF555|nr:response regulator transcription factor [Ferruginibacter sp.]MDB5277290.1 two component LuxR family transcriptional regulator [Ferruginibacter sp.]
MTATTNKNKPLIQVLIVDDHKMVRDGLKVMLASLNNTILFKVREADNGADAIAKVNRQHFDLLILDYQLPGMSGADIIYRILRFKPEMKILALSNYDELSYIQSMMDAGARGYVLKNIEPAEMLNAVKTILSGGFYYCSEVAVKLIHFTDDQNARIWQAGEKLTRREREVLQLIALEMTNEEIAHQLSVAKRTVDSHRQHLILKLQVRNTAGLMKAALNLNLW